MSSKVEVLCPNGHRVSVKTTPNTKVLQVLEEACNKKGFNPPSDYELRHGNSKKALDLTLNLRFAGLPNNAKLEMVKAAKSRESSNVTIALQLESGERLQHEFSPHTKLWAVLEHWQNQGSQQLTESHEGLHPVCLYMREEVQGKFALQETTLHDLGLLGGRAAIRLLHKSIDNKTIEEINQKITKEKSRKVTLAAKSASQHQSSPGIADTAPPQDAAAGTPMGSKSSHTSPEPMDMDVANQSSAESVSMDTNSTVTSTTGSGQEAMDTEEEDVTSQSAPTPVAVGSTKPESSVRPKSQPVSQPASGPDTSIPGVQIFRPGEMQLTAREEQLARQLAEAIMPGVFPERREADLERLRIEREKRQQERAAQARIPLVMPQPVLMDFKFPEETKGQNLYNNELSDKAVDDYKPCDRETVLYCTEDIKSSAAVPVEPGDDFFEITEADVKNMWADLQKRLSDQADQPLLTQAMRKANTEAKLNKYGRVFLRFTFQDRFVLQGTFRPKETVHNIYKFVKEHLEDKSIPFYLYTAPPKRVLEERTETLMEADLVPMTVVYFGSEVKQDHYLSAAVLAEKSTLMEANKIIIAHMPENSRPSDTSASNHHGNKRPTPQGGGQSTESGKSEGKTPKWFKVGKK